MNVVKNQLYSVETSRAIDTLKHLRERKVRDFKGILVGNEGEVYFLLYNLSGKIVGTQRYNRFGVKANRGKLRRTDPHNPGLRYVTRVQEGEFGVYGLHTYDPDRILYIVEGIFDCIMLHNLGLCAIAVLTNHCPPLMTWLRTLPNYRIVVADSGSAGEKLINAGHSYVICKEEYGDLNNTPEDEIREMLCLN